MKRRQRCILFVLEGQCVGMCGLRCITPGDIKTEECESHDKCVDEHSHAECLYDPPIDPETGEQYNSLVEAAYSWAVALFGGTGSVHADGTAYGNVYYFGDSEYYTPAPGGFCTYDIYCIDNPATEYQ